MILCSGRLSLPTWWRNAGHEAGAVADADLAVVLVVGDVADLIAVTLEVRHRVRPRVGRSQATLTPLHG